MRNLGFKFIDLPTAAERLGITRKELLQWVDAGRIRPFTGSGQQSVFRAVDVERLAAEVAAAAATAAVSVQAAQEPGDAADADIPAESSPAGRTRRRDPIKLVGTRISMDSRWAEITDQDLATWLDALETVQYERVRRVASLAIERLQRVLQMLDGAEQDASAGAQRSGPTG